MNKKENLKKGFLLTEVPVYFLFICIFSCVAICYFLFSSNKLSSEPVNKISEQAILSDCEMNQVRLKNYDLTRPLILVDMDNEASEFQPMKKSIENYIDGRKADGTLNSASVYVRKLNSGEWIDVNAEEKYNPASLLKIPMLIAYLKQSEVIPGFLNRKITDNIPSDVVYQQSFEKVNLVYGQSYSIKDLLFEMIVHSDNCAVALLDNNMDEKISEQCFTDIGINMSSGFDDNFTITTADFSRFYRVLYNATYLSPANSEYALSLLTKTDFNIGMTKEIPTTIKVAHKFGERILKSSNELHESGIVYISDNHPYLITIMTDGNDEKKLPEVISDISKLVFEQVTAIHYSMALNTPYSVYKTLASL